MRWFNRLRDYGTGGGAYGVRRQSGAATALSYNPAGLMIPTALQKRCRASLATAIHVHARQAGITVDLNAALSGAQGYLPRGDSPTRLLGAVNTIAAGLATTGSSWFAAAPITSRNRSSSFSVSKGFGRKLTPSPPSRSWILSPAIRPLIAMIGMRGSSFRNARIAIGPSITGIIMSMMTALRVSLHCG